MVIDKLINTQMIMIDFEAAFKEDAIKKICTQLFSLKLTDGANLLYKDIIARENIVSTFAGLSMAIPHAITPHIKEASLCFMRLKNKIIWNSQDEIVKYVLLLAVPEEDNLDALRKKQSYIFSSIAQSISQTETLQIWHEAKNEEEILKSLQQAFQTYLEE